VHPHLGRVLVRPDLEDLEDRFNGCVRVLGAGCKVDCDPLVRVLRWQVAQVIGRRNARVVSAAFPSPQENNPAIAVYVEWGNRLKLPTWKSVHDSCSITTGAK
jgi:hypothetical protein